MARSKSPTLTEGELRLMKLIWERSETSVADIVAAIPENSKLAYNTVLTTMRILEQKGYLIREKKGRAHIYKPTVSKKQARRFALKHIVNSLFDNSPELLLVSMLENENLSDDEINRLKIMIEGK